MSLYTCMYDSELNNSYVDVESMKTRGFRRPRALGCSV